MDRLAELLRQGADKLVNFPTEAQRFITNPQAFTQLLTGKNPMPKETGFAAGATGLPAQQGTVLDPDYQAYMQGYEQGEPVGYAGMALPFAAPAAVATAKALAPKAGMMAENYMVKQGMIQPLTAYHGTPHTIQGQFDINKVGTGEGAQAYGHGMYFAENPEVAKTYANLGTGNIAYRGHTEDVLDKLQKAGADYNTAELISYFAYEGGYKGGTSKDLTKFLTKFLKSVAETPEEMKFFKDLTSKPEVVEAINSYVSPKQPNLYKVDIPDEYMPNMVKWETPLSEMDDKLSTVINSLQEQFKNQFNPNSKPRKLLNEAKSVGDVIRLADQIGLKPHIPLQESGYKGIKYLDEGSRGVGKGTSNFVIFDPSQVKILELNSKPVTRKEILEQQINKIE